jgi:hypothetical protein
VWSIHEVITQADRQRRAPRPRHAQREYAGCLV